MVIEQLHNLQLLFKFLKNANYKTLIAQSGKKAIEIAIKMHPDLILLDVMMPGMNGFEVCRYLKTEPLTKDIPVIFMTALAETHNKVQGFELGAVDYLTKPFEERELLARIKTHLSLYDLHQNSVKNAAQRKLLFEISDRIRQSLDLNVILKTATQEIQTLLDCNFVGLIALDNQQVTIKAYSSETAIKIDPKTSICYDCLCPSPNAYKAYLRGHIEIIQPQNTQDCLEIGGLPNPQARLIVPILIKNSDYTSGFFSSSDNTIFTSNILYGWLIADQYSTSGVWQAEEINLLREISTQLAIAIKQGLLHKQLSQLALLDPLTRVYNRRSFDRQLQREWGRLKRLSAPVSLLMCDVDCNLFETLEKCDRTIWDNHRFSINLSGASLNNESFLRFLKQRLDNCPFPANLFCFEITESIAVSDMNKIVEFINSLKKIGCSFALDDFGKGVSSLTYLKNLPVDYLKIDGSFIRQLNNNSASKVMVEAINHIAEGIGLKTVAEFVENEAILNSVRELNVDYAQGFHLGRPEALMDAINLDR